MASNIYDIRPVQAAPARFPAGTGTSRTGGFVGLLDTVLEWLERTRTRRQLRGLDDRMLQDIGVSRYDAEREADKPFWQS